MKEIWVWFVGTGHKVERRQAHNLIVVMSVLHMFSQIRAGMWRRKKHFDQFSVFPSHVSGCSDDVYNSKTRFYYCKKSRYSSKHTKTGTRHTPSTSTVDTWILSLYHRPPCRTIGPRPVLATRPIALGALTRWALLLLVAAVSKGMAGETAVKSYKPQVLCGYEHCPRPPHATHNSKWRVVTPGTSAGGRDWSAYTGQTLCDGCYSTFRKHGTFSRSVRTGPGTGSMWAPRDGATRDALDEHGEHGEHGERAQSSDGGGAPVGVKRQRPSNIEAAAAAAPSVVGELHSEVALLENLRDGGVAKRPTRERKPSARMQGATDFAGGRKAGGPCAPLVAPLFEVPPAPTPQAV
jgi:hypothetical protein